MGIARRVVAAEYRRAAQGRTARERLNGQRLLDDDDIGALEERIDAQRHARSLYEHIRILPAGELEILEVVAVDGLSLTDAAEVLDIRPLAARVRWYRTRHFLRQKSAPLWETAARTTSLPMEVRP